MRRHRGRRNAVFWWDPKQANQSDVGGWKITWGLRFVLRAGFQGPQFFCFVFSRFFVCFCFLLSSSMAQLPLDVLPKKSTLPSYHISCGHRSFWSDTRPPVRFKRSTVGTRKTKILYDNASLTKSSSLCHTRISKISIFSSRTLQHSHNKTKSWPTSAT